MTSRRRPVFRHVCIVSLIIVAGCRRIEGESRPDQTASRSAAAQPQPSTELAKRVAQAFATRTIFPSSAIAQYLLSNRAHRALVIECMDAAGYGKYGYDTSDPPITPAMLDGHRLAFSWISPPAGFIELPTISKGSQVTPPDAPTWQPPQFATEEEQVRYDEVQTGCESNSEFPAIVDWSQIDVLGSEIADLEAKSESSPGFKALADSYATCVHSAGGTFSSPEVIESLPADPANPISVQQLKELDSKCRTQLYPGFIDLSASGWQEWLDRRSQDLEAIGKMWLDIQNKAGIPQ